MSEEETWRKWVPVVEKLVWQCYYRILSFISFPAPIGEAYLAAKELSEREIGNHDFGGKVNWIVEDRVFRWDDLEVSPGITMHVWFFGSAVRNKNTVLVRRGWWTMYLTEPIYLLMTAGWPIRAIKPS